MLIGYILRTSGVGGNITYDRINEEWGPLRINSIQCDKLATMSPTKATCGVSTVYTYAPQCFFTVYLYDQYGGVWDIEYSKFEVVSVYMFAPARGELYASYVIYQWNGINFYPTLPHAPEDVELIFEYGNNFKQFTYGGEAGVTFLLALENSENSNGVIYTTVSFLESDIDDYDWVYYYDDALTISEGEWYCLEGIL